MAFSTKAFGLFYKRLGPTGSNDATAGNRVDGYLSQPNPWDTYTHNIPPSMSFQGWLNFPNDTVNQAYITTHESRSINALGYKAFPFGSHACDFLWNITVPSWSFVDSGVLVGADFQPYVTRSWSVNRFSSQSFHKKYQTGGSNFGVSFYKVTSSWHIVEPKFTNSSSMHYVISQSGAPVPLQFIGSDYNESRTDSSSFVAYDIASITSMSFFPNSTSSIDGSYFHNGGGAGITRKAISQSLVTGSTSASNDTADGLGQLTRALRARRLFFPTQVTSSGASNGTDYWFKTYTGQKSVDLFTENGGIYNIQLTLKKLPTQDYYPDDNTFLRAFIHDVDRQIPSASGRIAGASGWYPPDNNIVTIGNNYNTSPAISFYDIQTGFRVEKFNFNLIQHGFPAQLCFEASGSLADDSYFGIIIDDIQICKVGVTTDPNFIKTTQASIQRQTQIVSNVQAVTRGRTYAEAAPYDQDPSIFTPL